MAPRRRKKKRVVATSKDSSTTETESEIMLLDRFTALPDYVSHHVLSFLEIDDLARVCFVSKSCRERALSTPYLNFLEFSKKFIFSCRLRKELLISLEKFMLNRGYNKIHSFRVNWGWHVHGTRYFCDCANDDSKMITWINNAVRCEVEELHLQMIFVIDVEKVPFPSGVFLCASLKSLVVEMNFTYLRTPSAFPSNLIHLELKRVAIEDEGFFKWISCSCKFVQELHLHLVYGTQTIAIENSSLKKIVFDGVTNVSHLNISGEKLEEIYIGWSFGSPSNKFLNIFTPNLKRFSWIGSLPGHTDLGNFKSLESARLHLNPGAGDGSIIKAPFGEGSMPAPIYDTSMLALDISSFTDELVPAMASLFKGCPKLFGICITSKQPQSVSESNTSGFNVEYWKVLNLAFIQQLKYVAIELCNESNGIDLARYLLECAPSLLMVSITCRSYNSEEVKRKVLNSKKLSNARVSFL